MGLIEGKSNLMQKYVASSKPQANLNPLFYYHCRRVKAAYYPIRKRTLVVTVFAFILAVGVSLWLSVYDASYF